MNAPAVEASRIAARLRVAGCVDAEGEAAELIAAAADVDQLDRWIDRRTRGEPVAWITGLARFCGRMIRVDHGVYVPRRQTEELARRARTLLPPADGRAIDLCTGSGAVATHLISEAPAATVIGVDIDPRAAVCARRNGVPTVLGDLARAVRKASFDVVTAVAPYVPTDQVRLLPADVRRYEPAKALDGGRDGLAVVRRVVAAGGRLLRPGGWLIVEVGGEQDRALEPALAAAGFEAATAWLDEDGDLRGLMARRDGPSAQDP